jgi:hypothetical protein
MTGRAFLVHFHGVGSETRASVDSLDKRNLVGLESEVDAANFARSADGVSGQHLACKGQSMLYRS